MKLSIKLFLLLWLPIATALAIGFAGAFAGAALDVSLAEVGRPIAEHEVMAIRVAPVRKPVGGWFWNKLWYQWFAAEQPNEPFESSRFVPAEGLFLKGGLLEQVAFYPKEDAASDKRIMRKGLLLKYKDAKATVLICHGFMCDKFDVGLLRGMFEPGTYNVMTFDFRAHGECVEGQTCTFGKNEAQDVIAAAEFIKNQPELKDKPLFAYSFSMGAVSCIEAQAQRPLFDGMILDCPFDSSENVIKRGLSNLKISLCGYTFDIPGRAYLEKHAFHPYVQSLIKVTLKAVAKFDSRNINTNICPCSPVESARRITVPCLMIHCKQDEKVPIAAGRAVYDALQGPKKFWATNGRHHCDSYFYNPEGYASAVNGFLEAGVRGTLTQVLKGEVVEDKDEPVMQQAMAQGSIR